MNSRNLQERMLTVGEVAALCGVGPDTVRSWERQGRLRAVRTPGGQRRFLQDAEEARVEVARELERCVRPDWTDADVEELVQDVLEDWEEDADEDDEEGS